MLAHGALGGATFLVTTPDGSAMQWTVSMLAGSMLVMLGIESISIGVDQWFGSLADPGSPVVSAALAPVFAVIAAIDFAFFGLYVRSASLGTAARTRQITGTAS
ncbi:MAG: hypothetical protein ACXW4H_07165 [Candidatus Limnocylindrales bacterium]